MCAVNGASMSKSRQRTVRGFVLIEAMVALVVMALGILGVAKLNALFIEVGGQAKARTQAVQLAESRLEQLRNMVVEGQFIAIADGSDSITGQTAVFSRSWEVVSNGTDGVAVSVLVSWTDRTGNQAVTVRSVIAWDNPAKAGVVAKGDSNAGQYAHAPTGRAYLGEGTMPVDSTVTPDASGLREQQGDDGRWRLVDQAGKVLLTATDENERFSVIEGNAYIDQQLLSSLAGSGVEQKLDKVFVVISDASVCNKVVTSPVSTLQTANGTTIYHYFAYRCYVGANWYGNIGIARTDNANTNDRVCLGDPNVAAVSYETNSASRHPVLASARMYRGYRASGGTYFSTGMGIAANGTYTAVTLANQQFLLTRITGNPSDADCKGRLEQLSTASPNVPFGGNRGKFVCLSESCPSPLPSGGAPGVTSITIAGEVIRRSSGDDTAPTLTGVSMDGATCTVTSDSYSCTMVLEGWTGSTWSGTMTVTTDGYVCSGGTSAEGAATPPAGNPAGSGIFVFSSQPVDVSTVMQQIELGASSADCP